MKKNIIKNVSIMSTLVLGTFGISYSQNSLHSNSLTKKLDNEYGSFINKPFNYRNFEKRIEKMKNKTDENTWQPEYSKMDWDNMINPKMDFDYALKYGWQSLKDWKMYARYVYENNYGKINNQFGYFNKDNANWIAWHDSPGMVLNNSYHDGIYSPVGPSWKGAEDDPDNHIDNNIKWFAYDQGNFFFLFNQKHKNDAFKRLKYEKRIVSASYSDIVSEKNYQGNDRNYFMVNGKLLKLKDLSKYTKYYYVSTDGDSDFVKDSYGWRVLVTENNLSILSKVINPSAKISKNTSLAYQFIPKWLTNQEAIKYPVDFIKKSNQKLPNVDLSREGKYKITYMYDNFKSITDDPTLIMPQERMTQSSYYNKYAEMVSKTPYSHEWAGGGYMFAWVEDGKGGHKIYKSLKRLNDKILSENNNKFLMYGNWHHVFPPRGEQWFKNIKEIYEDSHIE